MASIQTTVDKLVALINEYETISAKEVAKKLAMPLETIEEWAHILEQEGIIFTSYKFHNLILNNKQISDSELKKQTQGFLEQKVTFEKKLESAESYFNELDKKINTVISIISDLENNSSKKIYDIEHELDQLKILETKKEELDTEIFETKHSTESKLQKIEDHIKHIKHNYEKTYQKTKKEIIKEETIFKKDQHFLEKIKKQEQTLQKRLDEIKGMSHMIEQDITHRTKKVAKSEQQIKELKEKNETLLADLEEEHKTLNTIIKENQSHEIQIKNLHKEIYNKMNLQKKKITEKENDLKQMPKRLKNLLEHKSQIHNILNVISHEEIELKKEIEQLKNKAKIVEKHIGKKDYAANLEKLSTQIQNITSKRNFFKAKVGELTQLLDWSKSNGKKEKKKTTTKKGKK